MTKELPSPELLRKFLRYEPDTGKLFWLPRPVDMFKRDQSCKSWNARFAGKEAFTSINRRGYMVGAVNDRAYYAHRVAWAIIYGAWPSNHIDHINGVPSDNRIANLRDVPVYINSRNASMRVDNVSGHNGVSWNKRRGKWEAYIRLNSKKKNLGLFADIQSAISARAFAERGHGYTERHGTR